MGAGSGERDDVTLLRAIGRRDEAALAALYDRHAGWLTARLSRRCGRPDVVDQAVQDTFLAVWRGSAAFRGEGDVGAYLWGIAIRRLIDVLRRDKVPLLQRSAGRVREEVVVSAEDQVLLAVEHGRLGGALGRLSPELRTAIEATVLDGLSYGEAAVLLGVPEGTLKSRCHRARIALRAALLEQPPGWQTPTPREV
jgi:RNA polymerase sigma-70 factor, ECF subfamily